LDRLRRRAVVTSSSELAALIASGTRVKSCGFTGSIIMLRIQSRLKALFLAATTVAICGLPALAQTRPDTSAVYLYKGADRDARLVAAAKKEGTLTFYTSMQTPESGPLAAAFEKKYGVKVNLWRATSDQVLQRAVTEARGGRHTLDAIEMNAPEMEALAREEVVAEYFSPHVADLPAWAIPAHHKWHSDRANLWVVAFNTNKVKRADIPPDYEGFTDAKWRGKIGIETTDQDWMYGIVNFLGEQKGMDLFRKLAALKPDMRLGHALLAELIAAGEVPVGLTTYSGNADSIKKKGGPIDWVAVEPIVGRPQAVAVAKTAPHPNAALLFADFVLSPEGQKLLNTLDRVPASKTQTTLLDKYKFVMVDPIKWLDDSAKWEKIWKELFQPVR
jgi:iron(III) transport system substrate-binding protein